MPPTIVLYVSSHGFGHAARQQAVVEALAAQGAQVYVRTAAPAKFFRAARAYHAQHYDIGLIQPDALRIDVAASLRWYAEFLKRQPAIIAEEAAFVRQIGARAILSDMPPIACEIAAAARLPCAVATHFTWDWVYSGYMDAYPQYRYIVASIRASYYKATVALQMPFAHAFDMFAHVEPVPLVVNRVTQSRAEICALLDIPPESHIALLSMGGMAWGDSDLSPLRALDGWYFLAMPGAWEQLQDLPHARLIPTEFEGYHNLIAAADVVVGKAGGSTVAECIAHRTPFIYTLRAGYTENTLLHDALQRHAHAYYIPAPQFERGAWVDALHDAVMRPFNWPPMPTDGAEVIAHRVLALAQLP